MGCTQGTVLFEHPSGDYDYTGFKEHYREDGAYQLQLRPEEVLDFHNSGDYHVFCSLSPLLVPCQTITVSFSVMDKGWSGLIDLVLTRKGEIIVGQEVFVASNAEQNEIMIPINHKYSRDNEIVHASAVGDVYQVRRFVGKDPSYHLSVKNLVVTVSAGHPPICPQFEEWLEDKTFCMSTHQVWKWYPKSIDYWIAWVSTPPLSGHVSKVGVSFQIRILNLPQSTPYERRDFTAKMKIRLLRNEEVVVQQDLVLCRYELQKNAVKTVRLLFDSNNPLVRAAQEGDRFDIARCVGGKAERTRVSCLGVLVKNFTLRLSGDDVCCRPLRQKISKHAEPDEDYALEERSAEKLDEEDEGRVGRTSVV